MLYNNVLLPAALFAAGIQASSHDAMPRMKRQAPDGMVSIQTVGVGSMDGELKFFPETLQAEAGTMVQFQFYPQNHTVTQSTFDNPCQPISQSDPETPGINSGYMPVSEGDSEMPVWTVMINDTNPMWLYCAQGQHCQEGMVMSINVPPDSDNTMEQFKANAAGDSGGWSSGTGSAPSPTQGGGYGDGGYGDGGYGDGGYGDGGYGSGWNSGWPSATASWSWSSSWPTSTDSSNGDGSSPSQPADGPSGSAANPSEPVFTGVASKSRGDVAGYMAFFVVGYAILDL